jgi:hypothetical protein
MADIRLAVDDMLTRLMWLRPEGVCAPMLRSLRFFFVSFGVQRARLDDAIMADFLKAQTAQF